MSSVSSTPSPTAPLFKTTIGECIWTARHRGVETLGDDSRCHYHPDWDMQANVIVAIHACKESAMTTKETQDDLLKRINKMTLAISQYNAVLVTQLAEREDVVEILEKQTIEQEATIDRLKKELEFYKKACTTYKQGTTVHAEECGCEVR